MSRCRCCNTEIHGSEGKVYCNEICKAIFVQIKETVKTQREGFYMGMNMLCTTCKRKLVEGEVKYCSTCTERMVKEKERRANTDSYRPCLECGEDMKNPAPNRKWCKACGLKLMRSKQAAHDVKRKARRDEIRKDNPKKRQRAADPTDVHKSTINPYFLAPLGSRRKTG